MKQVSDGFKEESLLVVGLSLSYYKDKNLKSLKKEIEKQLQLREDMDQATREHFDKFLQDD